MSDTCLEDKRGGYQNYSVLYCVPLIPPLYLPGQCGAVLTGELCLVCLGLVSFCVCFCVFFLTRAGLFVTGLVILWFLCIIWLFFACQLVPVQLTACMETGKTCHGLWSDQLCVEQDVKLLTLRYAFWAEVLTKPQGSIGLCWSPILQ